ncbi:MAG TPA: ATP synthase F0 subunit C [Candidatus Acutalibacter pullistercoris]|uniref:ATP synthase subunit c n=1 Tax=Candidatus Acutalibacter pullistercoris TaxID=2838418 RepID=A0A9D1YDR5_9FIRM|nr:ATP synthase F0 subunit C [Candidatus Acutalibacter pullistercoris]
MKLRTKKLLLVLTIVTLLLSLLAVPALAAAGDDTAPAGDTAAAQTVEDEGNTIGFKALAVGLAIGLAAAGGGVGMGIVGGKAADGMSRQPDMESKIRTSLMLTMVFIETAIIYALLVVILVIFVL